jgi:hypothetical protein
MNTMKFWVKMMSIFMLVAVLAGTLAFPATVQAAGPEGDPDPARLERMYARLTEALAGQAERFSRIDEKAANVQTRINDLKAEGKDTSALETALSDYNAKVDDAKALYAEAAAILEAHTGFDASGKVVDAVAARETLKSAGEKMRAAHRELRPAMGDLLKALREFRRDNRPQPIQQP